MDLPASALIRSLTLSKDNVTIKTDGIDNKMATITQEQITADLQEAMASSIIGNNHITSGSMYPSTISSYPSTSSIYPDPNCHMGPYYNPSTTSILTSPDGAYSHTVSMRPSIIGTLIKDTEFRKAKKTKDTAGALAEIINGM